MVFWAAALIATLKGGLGKLPIAGRKRNPKHVDYNVTRSAFDQDLVRDTGYIKQRHGYKKCPLKAKQIETLFCYFAVAPGGPFDGSGALWRNTLTISLGKNEFLSGENKLLPRKSSFLPRKNEFLNALLPGKHSVLPGKNSALAGKNSVFPGKNSVLPGKNSSVTSGPGLDSPPLLWVSTVMSRSAPPHL